VCALCKLIIEFVELNVNQVDSVVHSRTCFAILVLIFDGVNVLYFLN